MLRLWAKIITDEKIKKSYVMKVFSSYARDDFFDILHELCYNLDIPTPIILSAHYEKFEQFKNMKFTSKDFVEEIRFDKLVIEDITVD